MHRRVGASIRGLVIAFVRCRYTDEPEAQTTMHSTTRRTMGIFAAASAAFAIGCASAQAATGDVEPRDPARSETVIRVAPRADEAPAAATRTPGTPNRAAGALRLEADISDRQLHLYEGGELVKSYTIAVGTRKDPTPRGRFNVRKLVWNPGWVPPDEDWARKKTAKAPGEKGNPMKVVKIFFREPDYYIHGTGDTESLGSAASHGCLRMAPSDAAEVGRYVMEHGGQPREESWFRRIFRFRSQTKVIYLRNPVPLAITD